jgi:hypothetical protein
MDSDLRTNPVPVTTDNGDHDLFAHIVQPEWKVTEAIVTGTPCTALCGKTWVPSRDPKRLPMCMTCVEICNSQGGKVPGI